MIKAQAGMTHCDRYHATGGNTRARPAGSDAPDVIDGYEASAARTSATRSARARATRDRMVPTEWLLTVGPR